MDRYNTIDWAAWALTTFGALNWGFRGLFRYNVVESTFGRTSGTTRLLHTLVGLSGIWSLVKFMQYRSSMAPTHRIHIPR